MKFLRKKWYNDPRSKKFSHHQLFGTISPAQLPPTLGKFLRKPEDQGMTLRCAAYAGSVNGGYIHGERMSPEWQAEKITQIQGFDIDTGGSDPNCAMRSQIYPNGYVRDVEWANADTDHAGDNGNIGYVKVDGPYDIFDDIRSALALAYDPVTKLGASVQVFGRWYKEWTYAGMIPSDYSTFAGYHSYLFVDFTTLNGVPYLIAQNSYGEAAGNGGYHFFPREVVNREFSLSNTSLKIPKPMTKAQIDLAKEESPWGALQRKIIDLWYFFSTHFSFHA